MVIYEKKGIYTYRIYDSIGNNYNIDSDIICCN